MRSLYRWVCLGFLLMLASAGQSQTQSQWDFGDAPQTEGYPTLLGSNGARHRIGGPWLGPDNDAPDPDVDGQSHLNALGDDHDGRDDEDGLTVGTLNAGQAATMTFHVNGGGGHVGIWVDLDRSGTWEPAEKVVSQYYKQGERSITITVPDDAVAGDSFARIRISSSPLSPVGPAQDGEVEDHKVLIRRTAVPDHFEPNNDPAEAMDLGRFGQRRTGLKMNGPDDEDWYKWHSGPGGEITVNLEPETDQGDFQADSFGLELYGSDGKLLTEAVAADLGKTLTLDVAPDEPYFIRVLGREILQDPNYILDILFQGSENYAVLFAGGIRPAKNYTRYYDNTRDLYNILVGTYKLDPDNIYILYADGTDPGEDLSSGGEFVDSDMSYAPNVLAGTPENLEDVLTNILAPRIDWNDHFFFWSFDHGGGDSDEPETLDEEVLSGWGSSVTDEDLATWLRAITPGRFTFVATQCYAGGMMDNLLPLGSHEHACAATNHYESSWGDGFAAAYNEGLLTYNQSHDVYQYAYAHDGYATDGEGPGGDVAYAVEHPWEATETNFPIFADNSNNLPWIERMDVIRFVPPWEEVIIPFELLHGITDLGDFDLRGTIFRVESVQRGQLLKDGTPVTPGQTIIGPGDRLTYLPAVQSPQGSFVGQAEPILNEAFDAFTLRAYDGATISDQEVAVPMILADRWQTLAKDDQVTVVEDAEDVVIDVLDNDQGAAPLSVARVGTASHGDVQLVNGQVLYSPAKEYSGPDSFLYFMADATKDTDWATVSIKVTPVNDPPEAYSDRFAVPADSKDNLIDVLDNDFDRETKPLTYFPEQSGPYPISPVLISMPTRGILIPQKEGTFLYTPNRGFIGVDSFAYRADDGENLSEVVTATLLVGPQRQIKWVQTPNTTPHGIGISLEGPEGRPRALADDFLCTTSGPVTNVHLWGSWVKDARGHIRTLRLSFYSDDPVGPGGSLPNNRFSVPDKLLWQKAFDQKNIEEKLFATVSPGEYWWDPGRTLIPEADAQIWQVQVRIPESEAFQQKGTTEDPVVYWLEVEVETSQGRFGWKTRHWPRQFNDNAVISIEGIDETFWQELKYPIRHPYSGLHFDDLTAETVYYVGNHFTTSSVPVHVKAFQMSNGLWTGKGSVQVRDRGGAQGNALTVRNANLEFQFPISPRQLSILFRRQEDTLNLRINGDLRTIEDLAEIAGTTVGGVRVGVAHGQDESQMALRLYNAPINSLVFGGQSILIDSIQWGNNAVDMAFAIMTDPSKGQ